MCFKKTSHFLTVRKIGSLVPGKKKELDFLSTCSSKELTAALVPRGRSPVESTYTQASLSSLVVLHNVTQLEIRPPYINILIFHTEAHNVPTVILNLAISAVHSSILTQISFQRSTLIHANVCHHV